MNSIVYCIRIFGLPIVIALGTILNTLLFFIMKRIKSEISFYMSILALADTGIVYKFIKLSFKYFIFH
jgi:hypothetical protein